MDFVRQIKLSYLNCLELLSGSPNLVLWIHRKRANSLRAVFVNYFFFSFVSRNCFAWPLILIKLQFVMTGVWYVSLSQSYSAVCNLKILKYTVFIKFLHLSNSHLRCVLRCWETSLLLLMSYILWEALRMKSKI